VGPFVKKATLYTGDVSRVWTQEIIPVEDFFMRCHNILLPVLQMIVSYFFQLLSSPDAVAVFRNMTELFFSSGDDPQLKTSPAWDRKTKRSNPSQIPTKVSSEVLSFLGGRH